MVDTPDSTPAPDAAPTPAVAPSPSGATQMTPAEMLAHAKANAAVATLTTNAPASSTSITSPNGVVSTVADLASRILTPSFQTLEGKLAIGLNAVIGLAVIVFVALAGMNVIHPSGEVLAGVPAAGGALEAWVTTTFVKNRTDLKAQAASIASALGGNLSGS